MFSLFATVRHFLLLGATHAEETLARLHPLFGDVPLVSRLRQQQLLRDLFLSLKVAPGTARL